MKGSDNEVEELFNPQNVSKGLLSADAITSILVFSVPADNIKITRPSSALLDCYCACQAKLLCLPGPGGPAATG